MKAAAFNGIRIKKRSRSTLFGLPKQESFVVNKSRVDEIFASLESQGINHNSVTIDRNFRGRCRGKYVKMKIKDDPELARHIQGFIQSHPRPKDYVGRVRGRVLANSTSPSIDTHYERTKPADVARTQGIKEPEYPEFLRLSKKNIALLARRDDLRMSYLDILTHMSDILSPYTREPERSRMTQKYNKDRVDQLLQNMQSCLQGGDDLIDTISKNVFSTRRVLNLNKKVGSQDKSKLLTTTNQFMNNILCSYEVLRKLQSPAIM